MIPRSRSAILPRNGFKGQTQNISLYRAAICEPVLCLLAANLSIAAVRKIGTAKIGGAFGLRKFCCWAKRSSKARNTRQVTLQWARFSLVGPPVRYQIFQFFVPWLRLMRSRLSVLAGRLLIAVARKVGTAKIRGPFGLRKKNRWAERWRKARDIPTVTLDGHFVRPITH